MTRLVTTRSRTTPGAPAPRRRGERGAVSVFVVGMAVVLLACAGLVVDGGGALNARMKLADDVEQAARAGAQELSLEALRNPDGGVVAVDSSAARARASQFISSRGYTVGAIAVQGDTVTVSASDTVDTVLLNLIGINDFDISATATSVAVTQ